MISGIAPKDLQGARLHPLCTVCLRLYRRLLFLAGKHIKVSTIGGSITAGQGALDAPNWPQYLFNWLEDTYGGDLVQGACVC